MNETRVPTLNVCMYVCPETLGQAGDFKNNRIWLKFGTLVPWVNIWRCFFHFLKIFIFKCVVTSFRQNKAKTFGQYGDFKNNRIWLKFVTFVPWVNIWGCFFHFLKNISFLEPWDKFLHLKEKLK